MPLRPPPSRPLHRPALISTGAAGPDRRGWPLSPTPSAPSTRIDAPYDSNIDGASAGTSTTTGAANATFALGGTSIGSGGSTTTGVLRLNVSGTSAGTSTTTGDLRLTFTLAGSSAGVGQTGDQLYPSATLYPRTDLYPQDRTVTSQVGFALGGTSAGSSTDTGTVINLNEWAGQSDGTSTTVGDLTLVTNTAVDIAVTAEASVSIDISASASVLVVVGASA